MKEYKTGDLINNWKIIQWRCVNPRTKNKTYIGKSVYALIQCQKCKQNTRYVLIYDLKTLSECCLSCKNFERNTKNVTVKIGQKYGLLTVIGDAGYKKQSDGKRRHYSIVQCDCGSDPIEIMDNKLQNGNNVSCGCISSKGEKIIESYLKKENIQYIREYSFSDCINPKTNRKLRFDFGIIINNDLYCLIEFDGRQHIYGPDTSYWGHTTDTLEDIMYRDNLKNSYCINNNIKLIRISYSQMNQIENILKEVLPNDDK